MFAMDFLMALTWALPTGAARSWDPTGSANLCKMQLQLSAFLLCNFLHFYFTSNNLPLAEREAMGNVVDYAAGRNRYIGYLMTVHRQGGL